MEILPCKHICICYNVLTRTMNAIHDCTQKSREWLLSAFTFAFAKIRLCVLYLLSNHLQIRFAATFATIEVTSRTMNSMLTHLLPAVRNGEGQRFNYIISTEFVTGKILGTESNYISRPFCFLLEVIF